MADMFSEIEKKVRSGQRLTAEEGLYLYEEAPLEPLGELANWVREERHGNRTSYIINMHLNYSNVCAVKCMFCAFRRDKGEEGAYEMSMEEMARASFKKFDAAEVRQHAVATRAVLGAHRLASASSEASAQTTRCADAFVLGDATQHSRSTPLPS